MIQLVDAKKSPLDGFVKWLPGELDYSARTIGYDKKIKRALLPFDDYTSIYGLFFSEWNHAQQSSLRGLHYQPEHCKSAQSRYAKFAAGLFDKAALGMWMADGSKPTTDNFARLSGVTAAKILDLKPWSVPDEAQELLEAQFEETPFSGGVKAIMRGISIATEVHGDERLEVINDFSETAIFLGGMATGLYVVYAQANLSPVQWRIPTSSARPNSRA